MEKISVLMSTYHETKYLVNTAVMSVINQTYKNIEFIIIVDDPYNYDLITCLNEFKNKDSRINIIINEHNLGLVQSLNSGLSFCSGTYIARMDADDISEPARLEYQLKFMKRNGYDLVGSWYKKFNDYTNVIEERSVPVTHKDCKRTLGKHNCIPHPGWLVKKTVYEYLKGYREIYSCEDYDFLLRAVLAGFKLGNVPDFLLMYRVNQNGISCTNICEQCLISKFLGKRYRMGRIVTLKEYHEYLKSYKYIYEKEKRIETYKRLQKAKQYKKGVLRFVYLGFNYNYYIEKLNYYLYKLQCANNRRRYGGM